MGIVERGERSLEDWRVVVRVFRVVVTGDR